MKYEVVQENPHVHTQIGLSNVIVLEKVVMYSTNRDFVMDAIETLSYGEEFHVDDGSIEIFGILKGKNVRVNFDFCVVKKRIAGVNLLDDGS